MGSRPHAVPGAARRRADRDLARAARPGRLGGGRLVCVPGRSRDAPQGVPARARGCASVDRRRRLARQGDDGGTDRVRAARDRPRPGLADRRARAAARFERRRSAAATSSSRRTSRTAPRSHSRRRSRSSRTSSSTTTPSSPRWLSSSTSSSAGSRDIPHVVRDAPPFDGELALPGAHNRLERGCRARGARACGRPARRSRAGAGAVHRHRPAVRGARVGRRARVVDDYGHHPSEVAAAIAAARERFPGRRVRVLFQPHLYSRTRHLASEFAAALAAADDVTVTDVYPAREAPVPGVTGKLIVDALSDRGVLAGWTPTVEQGVARLDRRGRDGRRAARPRRRRRRPRRRDADVIEENVPLARYTTIGTGGPARWFARPETARRSCRKRCAGLVTTDVAVEVIGLGSNVLVHDDGVDALVIRLAGELAAARSRRRTSSSRAAARRTRSACTARALRGSAGSSSRRRFPGRQGAACG